MKPNSSRKRISLETVDDYEQQQTVNTPKSLEACYREGIDPLELLYRPPEDFYEQGLSPRVQELNFNLFEAKRKDSLNLARQTRAKIIEAMDKTIQKSFSQSKFTADANFQIQVERAQEKKLRAIRQLVTYETQATENLLELQDREKRRRLEEERKRKHALKLERERNEQRVPFTQHLEEQKAARETQRREKAARKQARKQFQRQLKEEEKRREREEMEARERALHLQQSEEKIKVKLEKVEQNMMEQKYLLEQRLAQQNALEQERKRAIKQQQEEMRESLRSRSKENEQKRIRALQSFEQQLEQVPSHHRNAKNSTSGSPSKTVAPPNSSANSDSQWPE